MIFTDAKKSSLAFPFYAIQNQLFVKKYEKLHYYTFDLD